MILSRTVRHVGGTIKAVKHLTSTPIPFPIPTFGTKSWHSIATAMPALPIETKTLITKGKEIKKESKTPSITPRYVKSKARFHSSVHQGDEFKVPPLYEQKTLYEMTRAILRQDECPNLKHVAVIGNQHVTGPTLGFCNALTAIGVNPKAIGLIPKIYSMSPYAANLAEKAGYQIWLPTLPNKPGLLAQCHESDISRDVALFKATVKKLSVRIVVGLGCGDQSTRRELERVMPDHAHAYGELTISGLYDASYKTLHPIVDFARSALKTKLEPFILKILIAKKLNEIRSCYQIDSDATVGIIGNGTIGAATANFLISQGMRIIVYDEDGNVFPDTKDRFARVDSKETLVQHSQLVIDCTGKNPLRGMSLRKAVKSRTVFISFSSGEDAFLDMAKEIGRKSILSIHPLADYICKSDNGSEMIFAYGGKPITFSDNLANFYELKVQRPKFSPIPFLHYEGIACGLLGTFLQSVLSARPLIRDGVTKNTPPPLQQFDPYCQQWIAMRWGMDMVRRGIIPESEVLKFRDISWIVENSGKGVVVEHPFLVHCYGGEKQELSSTYSPAMC